MLVRYQDVTSWGDGPPPETWTAFYVRVTQEESVKVDLSIPNQIARCKEIAALRRWHHYRIYVEKRHVTAELWIDRRPDFRNLVEDIRAGRVTRVCARHTDRLWRGETQARLTRILHEHNVELWDFSGQHNYKSAHGRFSLTVLGAASKLEVDLTGERVREMKRGKARAGKVGGGPPPYGYTSQSRRRLELIAAGHSKEEAYRQACLEYPVGRCWYLDEKEAEIVRLIFELYTSPKFRYGGQRIAKYLNERGFRTRHGHGWLCNYVRRAINNPVYAGYTSYDEAAYEQQLPSKRPRHQQVLYDGQHLPLISKETWQQAQAIKEHENKIKRRRGAAKRQHVFALTGIIKCGACGCRMVGKWSNKSARIYYLCSRRNSGGNILCAFPYIDADRLHRDVWTWTHELLTSPQFVVQHLERLTKQLEAERPATERRTSVLAKRRDEIKAALAKYYTLFEDSTDPTRDAHLLDRVKELRAELQRIEEELADLRHKIIPFPRKVTEERVRALLERLRTRVGDQPEQQKAFFQELRTNHGFRIQALSKEEAVISLALPLCEVMAEEAVAAGAGARVFTVLAGGAAPAPRNGPTSGPDRGPWGRRGLVAIGPHGEANGGYPAADNSLADRDKPTAVDTSVNGPPIGPGLPKPGPSFGSLVLEHAFQLTCEKYRATDWAEAENAKGHCCQCGCGRAIKVLPDHRRAGIPQYLRAHHPMAMTRETYRLQAEGFLTIAQVARELGVAATTLRRLEGRAYPPVPRRGPRRIRTYTRTDLEAIRGWLRTHTGLGADPGLIPLEDVARRAGCAPDTLRRRAGAELPKGRRQLVGSRMHILFTPSEVEQILAWAKTRKRYARRDHSDAPRTQRPQCRTLPANTDSL